MHAAVKTQADRRLISIGALSLAGIILACLITYLYVHRGMPAGSQRSVSICDSVAQLESASANVLVRRQSQIAWRRTTEGMQLSEGDMIQTGSSEAAQIKFCNGFMVSVPPESIFSIRSLELPGSKAKVALTLSSGVVQLESLSTSDTTAPQPQKNDGKQSTEVSVSGPAHQKTIKQREAPPTLELERIVSFGKSLQLVGRIDPGNRLSVNGEAIDVAGDGTFKHFTKPIDSVNGKALLILKTRDLAGRVWTVTKAARSN